MVLARPGISLSPPNWGTSHEWPVAGERVEECRCLAWSRSSWGWGGSSPWCGAGRGERDEVEVVSGCQREVFGLALGDVEQEHVLVPGLVQAFVDVERGAVDVAEQGVDVAEDELPFGEAHRCAAGAAAA